MSQSQPSGRSENAGSAARKNLSKIIISANKEKNVLDLESNSGQKESQSKLSGRLKGYSAYNNESSAIDLRDSAPEDAVSTARNNPPQMIIPSNKETIVPESKAQK